MPHPTDWPPAPRLAGTTVRRSVAVLFVGLVLAGGAISVLLLGRGSTARRQTHSTSVGHGTVRHGLALPSCPAPTGALSSTVDVSTGSGTFSSPCYYAPADAPLTLAFFNDAVAEGSGTAFPLTLMISPASNPAVQFLSGTSGEYVVNMRNAVFVAPRAVGGSGGNAIDLTVPPLAAGTYELTTEQLPTTCVATLVVK
jgi:hypothetical protein